MGLSPEEWVIVIVGTFGGLYFLSSDRSILGLSLIIGGVFLTSSLKKFKRISAGFSIKSALYMSGFWITPSGGYPRWDFVVYAK